jgi:catechol 2,3-dioxygenase-like lactoylglutathione lyase family enzyme
MPDDIKIAAEQTQNAPALPPITGLNHFAWRCRDAEETRHFYEDILGLPLVHTIALDHVPSTGEYSPYMHLFFRMADGSCIAFFDLGDGGEYTPDPGTPLWVNHFAMEVADYDHVLAYAKLLKDNNIPYIGPTDHGFIRSIYFFDPNNLRLEITCNRATKSETAGYQDRAHDHLKQWLADHPKG